MLPQKMIKIFFLICLVLLNSTISGGADNLKGTDQMEKLTYTPYQEVMFINLMKGRKLLMAKADAMLDYQDPRANPAHDPPGKGH